MERNSFFTSFSSVAEGSQTRLVLPADRWEGLKQGDSLTIHTDNDRYGLTDRSKFDLTVRRIANRYSWEEALSGYNEIDGTFKRADCTSVDLQAEGLIGRDDNLKEMFFEASDEEYFRTLRAQCPEAEIDYSVQAEVSHIIGPKPAKELTQTDLNGALNSFEMGWDLIFKPTYGEDHPMLLAKLANVKKVMRPKAEAITQEIDKGAKYAPYIPATREIGL